MKLTEWMLIVTPVLGVLGTLGGVWLGYFFNERKAVRQHAIELQKENFKLVLQKGEELHQLVLQWGKTVAAQHIYYSSIIVGQSTQDDMTNYMKEANAGRIHDRLETLLKIYFPELEQHLKDAKASILEASNAFKDTYQKTDVIPEVLIKSAVDTERHFNELREAQSAKLSSMIQ